MTSPKLFSQMITSGLAFLLSANGFLSPAPVVDPLTTRLVIKSYSVPGETDDAVRQTLRSLGPIDNSGISRDAYTRWKLRWRWGTPRNGMVDLNSARIAVEVEMIVPRAELNSARWNAYHINLVRHELNHLRNALSGASRLRDEYRRIGLSGLVTLNEAQRISDAAVEEIRAADRRYDSHTDHGRTEGIRW